MDNELKTSIYSDALQGKSPGIVVKRDPEPHEIPGLLDWVSTEVGLIDGVLDQEVMDAHAGHGQTWDWEEYQIDYLENASRWQILNKPRQAGISMAFATKPFARGILTKGNYTGIFVSYKKEEAINKIRYVKNLLDALPPAFHKKIERDPLQLIEWRNANGTISKVISHAQKPLRGHHGDVFLDELGFYQTDREIYESALPVVTQVGGTVDITSTPFGKGGMFWDIISDKVKYPQFRRTWIYWWWCKRYLKEPTDEFMFEAMINAPKMSTEERVHKYGSERLKIQFKNLDLETFQQEFEGFFVDEQASFFSRRLIHNSMFDNTQSLSDYDPLVTDFTIPIEEALKEEKFPIVERYPDVNFKKYGSIEELHAAIYRGEISLNLYGGADIGTTRHSTHFTILEEINVENGQTLQIERFSLNRNNWALADQESYFADILSQNLLLKLAIDGTGIGEQMTQTLKKLYPGNVEVLKMSGNNTVAAKHMNNLRVRMENSGMALAYDRATLEDLYSIRSHVSESKRQTFRAAEKKKSHADAAWAISFASYVATPWGETPSAVSFRHNLSQSGYRGQGNTKSGYKRRQGTSYAQCVAELSRHGRDHNLPFSPGKFHGDHLD